MQFDFDNETMKTFRGSAVAFYWIIIAIIVGQFIGLSLRKVSLLPVWIFVEYLQLIAFMPVYNFRLMPFLYDAFKPALVAHFVLWESEPEPDTYFFNENYRNYGLSVGRLA